MPKHNFRQESKMWEPLRKFLHRHYRCLKTVLNRGIHGFGTADVVGIRVLSKDAGISCEVVTVEAKLTAASFSQKVGQALGYSVMAHRCYLAVQFERGWGFSEDQKTAANQLGVGLIEVRGGGLCKTVLSARRNEPLPHLVQAFLWNCGLVACSVCGTPIDVHDRAVQRSMWHAVQTKKPYAYHLRDRFVRFKDQRRWYSDRMARYICRDCVQAFGSLNK